MDIFATRHAGSTKVTRWTFDNQGQRVLKFEDSLSRVNPLQNKKKLNFETLMGKLKIFRVSSQGSSSDIAYQRSNASKFWKSWFKKSLNNIVHLVLFLEPLWCTGVKLITYILVARRLAWCPNGLIRLVRYQTGRASQVCSQALDLKETFSILRQIEGDGYILSKGDITK